MKALAIRLAETKEPVMVLLGHHKDWDSQDLFWQIDECTDPNECEYFDFKISKSDFGLMWTSPMKSFDENGCDFDEGASFINKFLFSLFYVFVDERENDNWKRIDSIDELAIFQQAANKADAQLKAALYEKLRRMSTGEFKKLVDQKVWEGKDFDELLAAWPETI